MSGRVGQTSTAETVLALAQTDPRLALETCKAELELTDPRDHEVRSALYRAMGIASRLGSDINDAVEYGELGVEEAELAGDSALRSKALMSLAASTAFAGDNMAAISLLDRAADEEDELLLAEIEFQRGMILGRMGETDAALACLTTVLPVFERHGDRESTAMTLHNRAMVWILTGDLAAAERDLVTAMSFDEEDGSPFRLAGEVHGLGVIAALRGDIPLALSHFEDSKRRFIDLVGTAAESQVSRCEVLLSAGLFREAFDLARAVVKELERSGLAEDEAEARLVGAQSALLAGRLDDASTWAERATEMFLEQGRSAWAALARLTAIQVDTARGPLGATLISAARETSKKLEELGRVSEARRARFLAGMIAYRVGNAHEAASDLSRVAEAVGPIESRLEASLARATLCLIADDKRGASRAARSGMRLLEDYQAALGATDIRLGVERHGRELGDLGLRLALDSKSARRVFDWMELRRGRALLHRPVTPPVDEILANELTELRRVTEELRGDTPEIGRLVRRQHSIQEMIRNRSRVMRNQEMAPPRPDLAKLSSAVDRDALVELASIDGDLWAVVVRDDRFRLRCLGSEAEVLSELESLRFNMRRLARGRGSSDGIRETARQLDSKLFGQLGLEDGSLVIVPTPSLNAMPWAALPTCQQRSVTLAPSAELWYRALEARPRGRRVLLAAGPDLMLADAEVAELAGLYTEAILLRSTESEVLRVESHLDGARVAHIASHAQFQFENPMFSSLRLADGDLNVYDIERLPAAPDLVVLSACDSGFSETHAGDELMGLSSALLSMGTRSIIASVGLVPDSEATKQLMVALHRRLIARRRPSQALHEAQMEVGHTPEGYIAASSFICIGAG